MAGLFFFHQRPASEVGRIQSFCAHGTDGDTCLLLPLCIDVARRTPSKLLVHARQHPPARPPEHTMMSLRQSKRCWSFPPWHFKRTQQANPSNPNRGGISAQTTDGGLRMDNGRRNPSSACPLDLYLASFHNKARLTRKRLTPKHVHGIR